MNNILLAADFLDLVLLGLILLSLWKIRSWYQKIKQGYGLKIDLNAVRNTLISPNKATNSEKNSLIIQTLFIVVATIVMVAILFFAIRQEYLLIGGNLK